MSLGDQYLPKQLTSTLRVVWTRTVRVGVVIGADRVSKESKYPDNGKAWIAVTIGYAFSN